MPDTITLRVITPQRVSVDTTVESVRVPGLDGSLGILARHAALVTALDSGLLEWNADGQAQDMFVGGGFAEVRDNTVRVVTRSSELASDIDLERAKRAGERARERLDTARARDQVGAIDIQRAEAALRRSIMRATVALRGQR